MSLISSKIEAELTDFLYSGTYLEQVARCNRIGVSYSTIFRYRDTQHPLAKLRVSNLEKLLLEFQAHKGKVVLP